MLDEALGLIEEALAGDLRASLTRSLSSKGSPSDAFNRLRATLSSQSFRADGRVVAFEKTIRKLDQRTRSEGFRVLHSWNHRLHRFTDDMTPVLMLDYFVRAAPEDPATENAVAILIDYYFLHLLSLVAMRAWDSDDPDAVLARVDTVLDVMQGPHGSGHRFVENAETAIIYALSQFHPEEQAYDRFIGRVRTLAPIRQTRFAATGAAVLGCHLRWGFWLMYGRDVLRMRRDNVGDYPWLLYSVATLARDYAALPEADETTEAPESPSAHRERVVGGLVQGLAADPWAFAGKCPDVLRDFPDEFGEAQTLLHDHGPRLLDELEGHRPGKESYSPLALHFNFPHNALVALVAVALVEGRPSSAPLDRLLRRTVPGEPSDESVSTMDLARSLMEYSGASPERLAAGGGRLVAYDPLSGARSFTMTIDALRERLGSRG